MKMQISNLDGLVKSQFFTRRHKEHEENLLIMKGFSLCDFVALCETSLFTNVSNLMPIKTGSIKLCLFNVVCLVFSHH